MAAKAETVNVKNVSPEEQMFTGHPPFAPGEVRAVSLEDAEILERSPFMEHTSEKPKKLQGKEPENPKNLKGIEAE